MIATAARVVTYELDGDRLVFRFVDPPSQKDLQNVVDEVARRVMGMLARGGLIGEARHESNEPPAVDDATAALRKVGLARGRFERIDARGCSQPSLFADDAQRFLLRKPNRWAAERDGLSAHAGVAFSAFDPAEPPAARSVRSSVCKMGARRHPQLALRGL